MEERTPLLSGGVGFGGARAAGVGGGGGGNGNKYYFLGGGSAGGETELGVVRELEELPEGALPAEFEPKVIINGGGYQQQQGQEEGKTTGVTNNNSRNGGGIVGFFQSLFQKTDQVHNPDYGMLKQRKAPIKVEPKVFFSNERTFMAWMHIAIILAGASVAIMASPVDDGDTETSKRNKIYGYITFPVAVAFIVYAMYQYVRRAYMIRMKLPGPYADYVGPTILAIMLMVSIVTQFAIKLYDMAGK